jgi:hypothetical protein
MTHFHQLTLLVMPFERELIESSYKAWRRYILLGLYKTTGLCHIGERIQMKKWFLIWKEIYRNRSHEQRLAIQERSLRRWVIFSISSRNRLHTLNKYMNAWQVHTKNEKHVDQIIRIILRERRLLKLYFCVRQWQMARQISNDNCRKFETLLHDYILQRSTLRLPNILAKTPFVIVSKHWKMVRLSNLISC